MLEDYAVSLPGELNDDVRKHLDFLLTLTPEQIVGFVGLLFDKLKEPDERALVTNVLEEYYGNRPQLRLKVLALFMESASPKLREQVPFQLISVTTIDPAVAETWALVLLDDVDPAVRHWARVILTDDADELASFGFSKSFLAAVKEGPIEAIAD